MTILAVARIVLGFVGVLLGAGVLNMDVPAGSIFHLVPNRFPIGVVPQALYVSATPRATNISWRRFGLALATAVAGIGLLIMQFTMH